MTRQEAVQALAQFNQPLEALRDCLVGFDFDWDSEPLVVLRRDHVLNVLRRWEAGELTDSEVEDWADMVEIRDDLDHDPADAAVAAAVFVLANPLLEGRLSEQAPELFKTLGS